MSRFADVIGQKLASTVLLRAVREEKVTHAYLFSGPESVGKMTTALAFASALNCQNPTENGDACGQCVSCRMISEGNHPDVQTISPSGAQTKIEQMKELRRSANFAPVVGKWKVMVVEQADTLNEAAANSILKTLEEPPAYLIIILLSKNPVLILPTIRSRCLVIRFANAGEDELKEALMSRFGAGEDEARFLTAYSEGRPGAAISLVGNENFFEWRRQVVNLAIRILSLDVRYALRLSEDLQNLAQAEKDGKNQRLAMRDLFNALILLYRDLLNLAIQGINAEIINSDLREQLMAVRPDSQRVMSGIDTLLWARKAVEGNANVQLVSDVVVMRLIRANQTANR